MKLSILNLAPVREGQTYLQAVESMVNLAKHAENIGIERYWIAEPYVILGVNAIVAETDKEARQLATTQTLFFLNVVTKAQQNLQPPMASEEDVWKAQMHAQKKPHFGPVDFEEIPIYNQERAVVEQMTACSLIGSPESVEFQLKQLRERVHFDEIMAVSYIFDEQKQAQSYTMLKAIVDKQ